MEPTNSNRKLGRGTMMRYATPDVTTVQVITLVQAVVGLLLAFGLDVSSELQAAIVQLVTAVAVVLPLADAFIRNGRARGGSRRERMN